MDHIKLIYGHIWRRFIEVPKETAASIFKVAYS